MAHRSSETSVAHRRRGPVMRGRRSGLLEGTISYAVRGTLVLIVLFPFYWMIVTSLKSEDQMRSLVSMFWPSPMNFDNYRQLLAKTEFVSWYGNSVLVSVSSTFVATAIGTLGAYAL